VAPVAVGIETFLTSTRDGLGLEALRDRISVGTTTMLGASRRLASWRAVQRELSHHNRRHDPAAMAEQQKQWKQMTTASRKRR
jgi:hypothetical protein